MKWITLFWVILGLVAWVTEGSARPRRDQVRERTQQHRIKNGVRSGKLTRPEARKLKRDQARIDHAQEKAKADGVVTDQEKRRLENMQDRESNRIKELKHN